MAEPVTMAEIDALRFDASLLLDRIRGSTGLLRASLRDVLEVKREQIDERLRRWWAQGFREVPVGGPVPEGPPYVVGAEPIDCCCCPGLERRLRKLEVPRG